VLRQAERFDFKFAMPASSRFPPPWTIEEQPACFVVREHIGQQLAYFEDELGPRSAAKLLSRDEARRTGQLVVVHFVTPVTSPTQIIR
jgi:hypothetical protein